MSASQQPIAAETVPPLEPGDRLTRAEFERRYEFSRSTQKAELIEGVVYMPSPARWSRHAEPQFRLMMWLSAYVAKTPGVFGGDNASIRLDPENELQPDATLIIGPKFGGLVRIDKDDYLERAPEWVAEVSSSQTSMDLHSKFHVYRRSGVREYVVWRVLEGAVDWFVLDADEFVPLAPVDGVLKSRVFPGLWLDPVALMKDDRVRLTEVVQQGLASPEHREFVAALQANAS